MEDLTGLRGGREAFVFTSRQYANVKETSVVQNAESQWPTVPRSTLCHGVLGAGRKFTHSISLTANGSHWLQS
jgi:hypothetical protein